MTCSVKMIIDIEVLRRSSAVIFSFFDCVIHCANEIKHYLNCRQFFVEISILGVNEGSQKNWNVQSSSINN